MKKAAFALLFPLLACSEPTTETPEQTATLAIPEGPVACFQENGAWCLTTAQAAATSQDTDGNLHWTLFDAADTAGLIVEPPSCRGRPADGVYRRTSGTILRQGENWKIARIGLREDRTCELLFMAPESAADSLQSVFLTQVNVCLAGRDCSSSGNILAARIGQNGIF